MRFRAAAHSVAEKATVARLPWLAWNSAVLSSTSVGPAPLAAVKMPAIAADRVRIAALTSSRGIACILAMSRAAEHLQRDADIHAPLAKAHRGGRVAGHRLGVGRALRHRRQVGQPVHHHQVDVLRAAVVRHDVDDALVPAEGGQVVVVLADHLVEAFLASPGSVVVEAAASCACSGLKTP